MIVRLQPASRAFCERRLVHPASSSRPTDSPHPQRGPFIFHRSANSARNRNLCHPFKIAGLQSLYLPRIRKRGGGHSIFRLPVFCVYLASSIAAATCRLFFSLCALLRARSFCFQQLAASFPKTGGWAVAPVRMGARS